ncbi:MAG TPA: FHA domain-containing protein [Solirubrobacteraceae bacterium]|nr:FHA domain-containing protein [Solirubrobacteraceae bacterium]
MKGQRFRLGIQPITFGRGDQNDVILASQRASRVHAELRHENGVYVLEDRGSSDGTWLNGARVTSHQLHPGDQITIGDEMFRLEVSEPENVAAVSTPRNVTAVSNPRNATVVSPGPGVVPALRVIVTGGGPVGLSFALLLEDLMGPQVDITVYDGRWTRAGNRIVWKTPEQGNMRRQQVVTVQSRQFRRLPVEVQERLFAPDAYCEMWPMSPDSIEGFGPRNIRISYIEDQLLAVANEKPDRIHLIPEVFDVAAAQDDLAQRHVLAICEGSRSHTLEHFADKFGIGDPGIYALDGKQVSDLVLGLRVKSELSDPMSVLLTVAQNRFLLNSLHGDGFLNMRLTDQEAQEAVGIDPVERVFTPCIQSSPCVLELRESGEFYCAGHHAVFLPAVMKESSLWTRVHAGLQLFGVPVENLTAVTGFRLDMVQRSRFTVQLLPKTAKTPGTFGFLLGDAANAIHFWPGRGLNSGLASAISLSRCLAAAWQRPAFRDADFLRHEAVMAMLQYRHKTRAWRQMVTTDTAGNVRAIKDLIAVGVAEGDRGAYDRNADIDALTTRMGQIRRRLESRVDGLPDDTTLRAHLEQLPGQLLHTLVVSEPWDTGSVGGEEVDVEWLLKSAAAVELV